MIKWLYSKARLTVDEAERLNPPWVDEVVEDEDNNLYIVYNEDNNWLPVGYVPLPRSKWRWFVYHLCHGIMMRYPLHKVVLFSLLESQQPRDEDGHIDVELGGTEMWYVGAETRDFTALTIDRNGTVIDE